MQHHVYTAILLANLKEITRCCGAYVAPQIYILGCECFSNLILHLLNILRVSRIFWYLFSLFHRAKSNWWKVLKCFSRDPSILFELIMTQTILEFLSRNFKTKFLFFSILSFSLFFHLLFSLFLFPVGPLLFVLSDHRSIGPHFGTWDYLTFTFWSLGLHVLVSWRRRPGTNRRRKPLLPASPFLGSL